MPQTAARSFWLSPSTSSGQALSKPLQTLGQAQGERVGDLRDLHNQDFLRGSQRILRICCYYFNSNSSAKFPLTKSIERSGQPFHAEFDVVEIGGGKAQSQVGVVGEVCEKRRAWNEGHASVNGAFGQFSRISATRR